MSSLSLGAKLFAASTLAGLMAVVAVAQGLAQQKATPPDFSCGWIGLNGGGPFFEPVPDRVPGPVTQDPAHPFVPNGVGKQPTYRIADLTNPNLKPWVKEIMKKDNDEVLAGKVAFTWNSSCMPSGVPGFMGTGGANPTYFLQTPKQVVIIHSEQFRHVYLDVPHSENPKPSWYGELVGHYEGDTLVIDTIGQNTRLPVDVYRTPHTERLHVVERWKVVDDGKMMEVDFYGRRSGRFLSALDCNAAVSARAAGDRRNHMRREQPASIRLPHPNCEQTGLLSNSNTQLRARCASRRPVTRIVRAGLPGPAVMSGSTSSGHGPDCETDAMGHVWTAPGWQGISSRFSSGRSSHVFGLLARFT